MRTGCGRPGSGPSRSRGSGTGSRSRDPLLAEEPGAYRRVTLMRTLPFTKMHGAGNDYVYVDAFDADVAARLDALDVPELARRVSNRNFGVGSDGLIVLARP